LVASGATTEELEAVGDAIAESYPQDDWQPVGAAPVDRHTINLMRLGPKKYPAPAATLMDARRLYLAERAKGGDSPEALGRFAQQVSRVVGHVRNALGCDPVLVELTRDDARTVRDYMLDRIMSNGKKIDPASVARDLN